MGIQDELRQELKHAMRARDTPRLNVLRAIETEVAREKSAPGFSGEVDDALYLSVITSYCKRMTKAIAEYAGAGERGEEMAAQLRYEVDYLARWMPSTLDEAATRALVQQTIEALGVSGPRAMGQVMGQIMKEHRGAVDGKLVNRLVKEALTG